MQKYNKLVQSLRLIGFITIGTLMAIHWLNLISGIVFAVVCGLIDQLFVKYFLKKDII
jgi:hypothetical protein